MTDDGWTYRILVTGSRDWTEETTIEHAIKTELAVAAALDPPPSRVVLIHGAGQGRNRAPGADTIADRIAARWQISREAYPANWKRYGRGAGPRRNQGMVDLGAQVCLAFPLGESTGTRGTMHKAERAGIPVVAYGPGCTLLRDDRSTA